MVVHLVNISVLKNSVDSVQNWFNKTKYFRLRLTVFMTNKQIKESYERPETERKMKN